jgi:hypothetical protein
MEIYLANFTYMLMNPGIQTAFLWDSGDQQGLIPLRLIDVLICTGNIEILWQVRLMIPTLLCINDPEFAENNN